MFDTHLHIPQLDDSFGFGEANNGGAGGVDSDQYNEIAPEDRPFLGKTVTISDIACALQSEGTTKAFTFFPVSEDIQVQLIEVADRTMKEYPSLFVPFTQSSGSLASTVEPDVVRDFLEIKPGLFFGQGEVGNSPTEPINPPPDSVLYTENFEVDRANDFPVYFHTGVGHRENMARVLESFPDITFIVHGDFIRPDIDGLMDEYPNIYFTFKDIFDELTPKFRFGDKEDFVAAMRADWDVMLEQADDMYREMIEDHPDRYMWGTDRVDIAWNYDEDIGQLLAEFGRAFIGRFDPEIQEMLAYKNAETILASYNYQN